MRPTAAGCGGSRSRCSPSRSTSAGVVRFVGRCRMPTPHDPAGAAALVGATLDTARRRIIVRDVLRALASGAIAAAVVLALSLAASVSIAIRAAAALSAFAATGAAVIILTRKARTRAAAAGAIERAYPSLRNLAVTGAELIAQPDRTRPYMWNRVMQAAAQALTGVAAGRAVPLTRDVVAFALSLVAIAGVAAMGHARADRAASTGGAPVTAEREDAPGDVLIDVVPPAYTGRGAAHLRNPASIEGLAGSRVSIRVIGTARPSVRVNGTAVEASAAAAEVTLVESGSMVIDAGRVHRLLPLTVLPDAAPDVRVTAPGKDLRVASANTTIAVHATAADDIGLRAFELRYTIVS